MLKIRLFSTLLFFCVILAQAQTDNGILRMDEFRNPQKRQIIAIPDVGEFKTLKCDFHTHTIFSDGHVWPVVRVQEAWEEGIDVISITDHIEFTPHSEDVPNNYNRAYELAKDKADEYNIILIKGAEITRKTPPGHFNALFIDDASGYINEWSSKKDNEAVLKAVAQNAFIIWNHPGWRYERTEGSYEWIDFVDELYNKKNLHGVEVFNGFWFHKKALDWAIDKNLTIIGSTDIHNLIKHHYKLGEDYIHRTMTLVFTKERTADSVREALEKGRTVAWSSKYIAGKEEYVRDLFYACVKTNPCFHSKQEENYYEITNNSDLYFELELNSEKGTKSIVLYPRSSQVIIAPHNKKTLTYEVVNAFIRSDKNLIVDIPLKDNNN